MTLIHLIPMRYAASWGVMLSLVFFAEACSPRHREQALSSAPSASACSCTEATPNEAHVIDTVVVAWLSKARSLHHSADLAEGDNETDRAIALLQQLVHSTLPPERAPETEAVLADTHARLAELRSRIGDFDNASRDIDSGLLHAQQITYFHGHLLEVRGLVEERKAHALEQTGQRDEARRARERASQANLEAIAIQDAVIQRALQPDGGHD